MASFLLHAFWVQRSGLHLWIEQIEGHRIVVPDSVPHGTFPPVIEAFLGNASFRHRLQATLRTPKGREVSLTIPTAAYAPEQAVDFFACASFLDQPGAGGTAEQRAAIAPDLLWLERLYVGLTRFVAAGRVALAMSYEDEQWFPQWRLVEGLAERSWIAEMTAAAPGVLVVNNRRLVEDLVETLPHWIASARLAGMREEPRSAPRHEFVDALLHNRPLRRGGVGLVSRLNEWRESISKVDYQLVVIVEEPGEGSPTRVGDASAALWPVRLMLRVGTGAPAPLALSTLDEVALGQVYERREEILRLAPELGRGGRQDRPGSPRDGDWDAFLSTEELVDFVGSAVPKLRRAGVAVMLPKSWTVAETRARLETRDVARPERGASRVGLDRIVEYDWKVSVDGVDLDEAEMEELVTAKSGLIRLRGRWVMADTAILGKVGEYMDRLRAMGVKRRRKELEAKAARVEMLRLSGDPTLAVEERELEDLRRRYNEEAQEGSLEHAGEVSLAELRQLAIESAADEPVEFTGSSWYASLLGGAVSRAPARVEIPDTVRATLRDYQRRGVDWLYWMSRNNLGAVLADDMGLGKTLQLLALLAVERGREEASGPTLVVAPTSVVGNWAREAARFTPGLTVLVHHGPARARGYRLVHKARAAHLVITSYGVVSRDVQTLAAVAWDHVVLDEAQQIKNPSTRSAKAARALPARQRIALTGTPVENQLSEMRSILDFVNPGVLGSAQFFRNHFARPIERDGDEALIERLRRLTALFILRRLKTDPTIIDDLPEKDERVITVRMTREQAALYQAYVEDVKVRIAESSGIARRGLVLASLTRIKQICNHPAHFLGDGSPITVNGVHRSGKVRELVRLLDDAVREGRRTLIFTQYRAFGDMLQPYLSDRLGCEVPFLHGGVPQAARDRMVADFQSPDGPPAMVLSLKAGGTGLNLTAASVVVHMDRWWNPAVENQATDRAFRIGQHKDVVVFKIITAGTLEESIKDILDGKTELAGAVIGEGEGWITELDPQDLARLMSYRDAEPAGEALPPARASAAEPKDGE